MSFVGDLRLGQEGERRFRRLFIDCGGEIVEPTGAWDFECRLGPHAFAVEVKRDLASLKTGNIAIEYHNPRSGKPSGLFATRAELWGLLSGRAAWLTSTAVLKDYFHNAPCVRDIKVAGDDNASIRLFLAKSILPAIFHRVDRLHPAELYAVLGELL